MRQQNSARKHREELGVSNQILPFDEKDYNSLYYQVSVGQFGVKLSEVINVDTLDGLQLIVGKATRIDDVKFAYRVANATGGTVLMVTEKFTRRVDRIESMQNLSNGTVQGEVPHDIRRGLELE